MDEETRQLIDFDRAEVVRLKVIALPGQRPQYELVVTGMKPQGEMEVDLTFQGSKSFPRTDEYYDIAVIGISRGSARQDPAPYQVSRPLSVTGTRGVVVVGATRFERKEVPSGENAMGDCRDWVAMRKREPGKTPLLYVAARCVFPGASRSVELKRHEPQGASPGNLLLDRVVHEPEGPVEDRVTVVDAVYRESTGSEHDTVTVLPEGHQITVEDVDLLTFLDTLMRRSLGR